MQYLLTEEEYQELSARPKLISYENTIKGLRQIAMKAAGIEKLPCEQGCYCDNCIFSGYYTQPINNSQVSRRLCPYPEKKDYSK